jgi:predicted transcriptional regulator
MRSSLLQAFLVVFGLVGCSSSAYRDLYPSGQGRLDVLTSFSLALSKYDFREAARYLAPADRAKLAGPEGILPEYRERVRAIRRTTLLNNPLIEVQHGLIYGIPDVLPVLALGEADTTGLRIAPDSLVTLLPDSGRIADSTERAELRRASQAFFRAVSRRDWKKAMAYLDNQERGDFVDAKGKVKDEARQRLAEVDTTGWEALTLKDGKLTGVVLIIPGDTGKQRPY